MVTIPAGEFLMGTPRALQVPTEVPAELQPLRIEIKRRFALGRFEVTRAEFQAFASATNFSKPIKCRTWVESLQAFRDIPTTWDKPNLPARTTPRDPASCVNWHDAQAYVAWLSQKTGQHYRLPSETEWEYAARAGSNSLRFWGNDANAGCRYANTNDLTTAARYPLAWTIAQCRDGFADVAPVGSLRPNAFGLYDMIGNVWEWLQDCASLTYVGRPRDQRAWEWAGGCQRRIERGGGWITGPERSRSAFHGDGDDGDRADFTGFRVARDLDNLPPPSAGKAAAQAAVSESSAPAPAPQRLATPALGSFRDCADCPQMQPIAGAQFLMGSSSDSYEHDVERGETPPLNVTIRRGYALSTTEVTRAQWLRYERAVGRVALSCPGQSTPAASADMRLPQACITAPAAQHYLDWLSRESGQTYRLPSEAEWEFAARAGSTGARFWSARDSHEGVSISHACEYANVYDVMARDQTIAYPYARCSDGAIKSAAVAGYQPNAYALYDMIGNLRELTADCYTSSYKGRPADERAWIWGDCELRVVRGGSYRSRPLMARSAARDYIRTDAAADLLVDVGLRLARDLLPSDTAATVIRTQ